MVNPDQTCVVCDLGFAMKIARTRLEEEGEMTSLTDVSFMLSQFDSIKLYT